MNKSIIKNNFLETAILKLFPIHFLPSDMLVIYKIYKIFNYLSNCHNRLGSKIILNKINKRKLFQLFFIFQIYQLFHCSVYQECIPLYLNGYNFTVWGVKNSEIILPSSETKKEADNFGKQCIIKYSIYGKL